MVIILIDIPENITKQEIENFIGSSAKDGHIEDISIVVQKNLKTHQLQYHGLVMITPDSVAKKTIVKLTSHAIKDKPVAIREYQSRSIDNDRRNKKNLLAEFDYINKFNDRRKSDRRHQYSEVLPIFGNVAIDTGKPCSRKYFSHLVNVTEREIHNLCIIGVLKYGRPLRDWISSYILYLRE